ncbi:MAG TPA: phosphate transport system regulatory protein PhoU, partial [Syntrophobacteraceae bacterium]|nr:phosphate transport system regulatory protein PhoU [Syntrophobacteraceae bacterium]
FHRELEDLKATILHMAELTVRAMEKALRALFERNEQLAIEVIEKDQVVNLLEVQVDRLILKLLALAQPMARDLRFIVGCM